MEVRQANGDAYRQCESALVEHWQCHDDCHNQGNFCWLDSNGFHYAMDHHQMKKWAKKWANKHTNVNKLSLPLALKMDLKRQGQVTATSRRHNIHTEKEAQRAEEQTRREAEEKKKEMEQQMEQKRLDMQYAQSQQMQKMMQIQANLAMKRMNKEIMDSLTASSQLASSSVQQQPPPQWPSAPQPQYFFPPWNAPSPYGVLPP